MFRFGRHKLLYFVFNSILLSYGLSHRNLPSKIKDFLTFSVYCATPMLQKKNSNFLQILNSNFCYATTLFCLPSKMKSLCLLAFALARQNIGWKKGIPMWVTHTHNTHTQDYCLCTVCKRTNWKFWHEAKWIYSRYTYFPPLIQCAVLPERSLLNRINFRLGIWNPTEISLVDGIGAANRRCNITARTHSSV